MDLVHVTSFWHMIFAALESIWLFLVFLTSCLYPRYAMECEFCFPRYAMEREFRFPRYGL